MNSLTTYQLILKTLKGKSSLKLDVYNKTSVVFAELKSILKELERELKADIFKIDPRIKVEYFEKGEFDCEFRIAGDLLIFHMHSNIFEFDKSHPIWRSSYVRDNEINSYCGLINIYNFLNDSVRYNRVNDIGYLISRIFINHEDHFFVEGKRQMGYFYNDFMHQKINRDELKRILEAVILYCLDFDLLTPPYESVKEINVYEVQELSNNVQISTGKRLGFKFQADDDIIS